MTMSIYDAAKVLGLTGTLTPEDIRTAFREAAKKYHPDVNPAGLQMMQLVNAAFEALKDYSEPVDVKEQDVTYGDLLNEALNAILHLDGLDIEICGAWVWVGGNTFAHKQALKTANYKWAPKKLRWYFRPAAYRSWSRGKYDMDEIRERYGSTKPNVKYQQRLAS